MTYKREHKRAVVQLSASYIKKDNPDESKEIIIRDISAGGLCFEAEESIDAKTIIIISVYLKDEDITIKLEGKIMWNRFDDETAKQLNGILFTDITSSDFQSFLSFYCKQILSL